MTHGDEYIELHEHPTPRKMRTCHHRLQLPTVQMSRKWFAISMFSVIIVFYVLLKIELQQLNIDFPSITGKHSLLMLMVYGWDPMQDWTDCMADRLQSRRKDWIWDEFDAAVRDCVDKTPVSKIEIEKFGSEEYYRFGATTEARESTLVSIGAVNTVAEEALKRLQPGLAIHGTNSSSPQMNASFHIIGRTHNVDFHEPSLFSLNKLSHNHQELVSLLQEKVKKSFLDHLWINAGSFGHELLSIMHRGGLLDSENIEMCQVNFEMTKPSEDQMSEFANFVVKSLQQQRYYFVKSEMRNDRYLVYFVNMENAACITKYFLKFF